MVQYSIACPALQITSNTAASASASAATALFVLSASFMLAHDSQARIQYLYSTAQYSRCPLRTRPTNRARARLAHKQKLKKNKNARWLAREKKEEEEKKYCTVTVQDPPSYQERQVQYCSTVGGAAKAGCLVGGSHEFQNCTLGKRAISEGDA